MNVDQFYGMEISEWPARIAEVSLWLMDHKMNMLFSESFNEYFARIPLKKSPNIRIGNALTLDWEEVLPRAECSYILGNPPFSGARIQSAQQRAEIDAVFAGRAKSGALDYVSGWYAKAADYISGTGIRAAFVSTNSITQGEQVGILWNYMKSRGISIHFAYRTFRWQSEARGKAHVHVVIVGFGAFNAKKKTIYEIDREGEISSHPANNINGYLLDGGDVFLPNRNKPLSAGVPEMGMGNQPIDGGNYLFSAEGKRLFLLKEPRAEKYFKRWYGSEEFLNGVERWCLWLGDCPPGELRSMPECLKRVENVRDFRLKSKSKPTNKLAKTPTRFNHENMPQGNYIVVPEVSSEKREYIPIGFLNSDVLCSNLVKILPGASLYHFGILTSAMHNAWMRQVAGRLKSDYRYSVGIVYNNFAWPENVSASDMEKIGKLSQKILDARAEYPLSTLADLYDPLTMPPRLKKAHEALDRAVDRLYKKTPFKSEAERVELLFTLYSKTDAPVFPHTPHKRRESRISSFKGKKNRKLSV